MGELAPGLGMERDITCGWKVGGERDRRGRERGREMEREREKRGENHIIHSNNLPSRLRIIVCH